MSCSCIYVGRYDDPDEDRSYTKTKRSVKSMCCGECSREIKPLEKYEYADMVYEGWRDIFITCKDCLSVREEFFCDGWFYEHIWEYVYDHLEEISGEVSSECLLNFTKRARDKVCDIIHYLWDKMDEMDEEEG